MWAAKSTPAGSAGSAELINLAALKRYDEKVEAITATASHVALYLYDSSSSWKSTNTEGALFVFRRSEPPRWGFFILNRQSTQNVSELITPELDFQAQEPFVLYKKPNKSIYGIWFYKKNEFQDVGRNCILSLSKSSSSAPNSASRSQKPTPSKPIADSASVGTGSAHSLTAIDPAIASVGKPFQEKRTTPSSSTVTMEKTQKRTESTDLLKQLLASPKSEPSPPGAAATGYAPLLQVKESEEPLLSPDRLSQLAEEASQPQVMLRPEDFECAVEQQEQREENERLVEGKVRRLKREVHPLTRQQMQEALLHLIKNDENFVDVLHDAYIKSVSKS